MTNKTTKKETFLQLDRLKTLMDVIYGVVIVRVFLEIPAPGELSWHWESIGGFLRDNAATILGALVGLAVAIIYWIQNNVLLGKLERTDSRHTALSIIQVFFLFFFIYAIDYGIQVGASWGARAFESIVVLIMGLAAARAWAYAIKDRRLLKEEVPDEEAIDLRIRYAAEPATALITFLFVFTPILWELSWFLYPLVVRLITARIKPKKPQT